MTPPGRVHSDLTQGRIESARAVDEQNLACMMEANAPMPPMPPRPPFLTRPARLDLNQTEWQLTEFCIVRYGCGLTVIHTESRHYDTYLPGVHQLLPYTVWTQVYPGSTFKKRSTRWA